MKNLTLLLLVLVAVGGVAVSAQPRVGEGTASSVWAPLHREFPAISSEDAEVYYRTGTRLLELGRYNEAIEAFQKAIKVKSDSPLIHNDLGYSYFLVGKYGPAVAAYREAIRLQPNYALAHNNLGAAYLRLKDYENAYLF